MQDYIEQNGCTFIDKAMFRKCFKQNAVNPLYEPKAKESEAGAAQNHQQDERLIQPAMNQIWRISIL